jgi:hypothetical protein
MNLAVRRKKGQQAEKERLKEAFEKQQQ